MPKHGDDSVWSLVMFDLPVKTKAQRSRATKFRNGLLDLGYQKLQFSVYVQYLPASARAVPIIKQIKEMLPPDGEVRILSLTDRQWSKGYRFVSDKPEEPEEEPLQLQIF